MRFTNKSMRFTKIFNPDPSSQRYQKPCTICSLTPNSHGETSLTRYGSNPFSEKGTIFRGYHAPNRPSLEGKELELRKKITPNESRAPALHVGMLTSSRECLDKKFWPFLHFSASFYVRIPGNLDRPNSRQ